jgi:NitT/TauT family transport system ATP-binding protein
MNALEVQDVSHAFGNNKVLGHVNLKVAAGQVVGLVGPSGCGKSTLLRAILGTHPPNKGKIFAGGKEITGPNRDVGIVYQHYSLYPFLTAEKNVAFGLLLDETTLPYRTFVFWKWWKIRQKHLAKARELLKKLGLETATKLYPHEMSGGMRQRVAIAQALIMKPKILLLDEPFGALDEATREELQLMILGLYAENEVAKKEGKEPPYTILLVTHELNEAFYVSDRVIGLSQYHKNTEEGAKIVYDKPAPIFRPGDPREFEVFLEQREELRRHVFDSTDLLDHEELITFWKDHEKIMEG